MGKCSAEQNDLTLKKFIIPILGLIFAFSATASCGQGADAKLNANIDTIVSATLGDSIYCIIKNAKNITAEVIGYNDTVETATSKVKLSNEQAAILKFLISNPDNVASDDVVYGLFLPNAVFSFKYKKQELKLYYDYGLRKWQINDADDKTLMKFDLRSTEFLRFALVIFPENDYFNKLIKKSGL